MKNWLRRGGGPGGHISAGMCFANSIVFFDSFNQKLLSLSFLSFFFRKLREMDRERKKLIEGRGGGERKRYEGVNVFTKKFLDHISLLL